MGVRPGNTFYCFKCSKKITSYPCPHCEFTPGQLKDMRVLARSLLNSLAKGLRRTRS